MRLIPKESFCKGWIAN